MNHSGYAFVVSNIKIDGAVPVEVIPDHQLRRARDSEIEFIASMLNGAGGPFQHWWPRYDSVVREERYEGNTSYHYEKLPREQWRYWVVAYNGNNMAIHKLERVIALLETDFDFGFHAHFQELDQKGKTFGYSGMPLHIVEKYARHEETFTNAKTLRTESLSKLKTLMMLDDGLLEDYSFVKHALGNYLSVRRLPRASELRTVGYFAIIEALITHAPRLTETLDSISHQIRNKAVLLRKKFERDINPGQFFLHATEQKWWTALYSYRSRLAHGGIADFQGEHQILKDQESVTRFLKEFIKELLIFALKEPEFLKDLKQC